MSTGAGPAASAISSRSNALFVLEQTLGTVVYGALVERAAAAHERIDARVVHVHDTDTRIRQIPVIGSWTMRAGWAARRGVNRAVRQRQPDAAFVCTSVSAMLLGDFMRRVPTVVSTDATPINYDSCGGAYGHEVGPQWLEGVKRSVVSRMFRAAAAVVAWSSWTAESLINDYGVEPARVHKIPPGVDLSVFACDRAPRGQRPLRVLFVGGDVKRKGGWDLIDAVAGLDGRAELDLVTSERLVDLPAGVRAHAGLTHKSPELRRLFESADVFALPTHGDMTPHAVVEAMASGLPVVSTKVGAIPELVADGERGLLIRPGDVRQLRESLDWVATHPKAAAAMGAKGSDFARRFHDSQVNMRRLMDLIIALSKPTVLTRDDRP